MAMYECMYEGDGDDDDDVVMDGEDGVDGEGVVVAVRLDWDGFFQSYRLYMNPIT